MAENGKTALSTPTGANPRVGHVVQVPKRSRWIQQSFAGARPETIRGVLDEAALGFTLERWADLVDYMLETDPDLQSVFETRMQGVAGKAFEIEAGPGPDSVLAEEGAAFIREAVAVVPDLEKLFADLLAAIGYGYSLAEHDWCRINGSWLSRPEWIHPRLQRFSDSFGHEVRTGDSYKWVKVEDYPNKFIRHLPRSRPTMPTRSGLFRTACFFWLYKIWTIKAWMDGAERVGSPPIIGRVPAGATPEARRSLFADLEDMSYDHVGIVEEGVSIEVPDFKFPTNAEMFNALISKLDAAQAKLWLGSTLNVEVGDTGGNRALGESQESVTISPRLEADGRQLSGTLERDWFRPTLAFNSEKFNGRIPPTPRIKFQVVPKTAPEIFGYHMKGKLFTRDEVRATRNQPPATPEQLAAAGLPPNAGGELLDIQEGGSAPALAASGGEPAAVPFSRSGKAKQMPLPWTSRGTTSPTSSDSTHPLATVLRSR